MTKPILNSLLLFIFFLLCDTQISSALTNSENRSTFPSTKRLVYSKVMGFYLPAKAEDQFLCQDDTHGVQFSAEEKSHIFVTNAHTIPSIYEGIRADASRHIPFLRKKEEPNNDRVKIFRAYDLAKNGQGKHDIALVCLKEGSSSVMPIYHSRPRKGERAWMTGQSIGYITSSERVAQNWVADVDPDRFYFWGTEEDVSITWSPNHPPKDTDTTLEEDEREIPLPLAEKGASGSPVYFLDDDHKTWGGLAELSKACCLVKASPHSMASNVIIFTKPLR